MLKVSKGVRPQALRPWAQDSSFCWNSCAAESLHGAAEEAARAAGSGCISYADGTYEDIMPHSGGVVRSLLDRPDTDLENDHGSVIWEG